MRTIKRASTKFKFKKGDRVRAKKVWIQRWRNGGLFDRVNVCSGKVGEVMGTFRFVGWPCVLVRFNRQTASFQQDMLEYA